MRKKKTEEIINYLLEGKVISLISDAGTPIISDPGNILIKECIKNNIKITPIPGPSSAISSLTVSGFSDRFTFYGFLSQKKKDLIEELEYLSDLNTSIVLYFSPNKLNNFLDRSNFRSDGYKLIPHPTFPGGGWFLWGAISSKLNITETFL